MCDPTSSGFSLRQLVGMTNSHQRLFKKWPQFNIKTMPRRSPENRGQPSCSSPGLGQCLVALSVVLPTRLNRRWNLRRCFYRCKRLRLPYIYLKLGDITDCRAAGDTTCSDETYQRAVEDYESSGNISSALNTTSATRGSLSLKELRN